MRKICFRISIAIFSLLFFIPLILVLSNARIGTIIEIFANSYYKHIILFTFKQSLLSAVLSTIIGLPGAWIITRYDFKMRKFIKLIYYIPFVLPSILVVLGFVLTYGKNGFINSLLGSNLRILYSFKAVLLAHVFYNFPVVCSIVSNKWESLDGTIEEEARLSGASDYIVFKQITLPRLIPSIVSSSILVFLFCFTSFAIILVLGGNPKLSTIEVEIYRQARTSLNITYASSLSLLSLISALLLIYAYLVLMKNSQNEETSNCYRIKIGKTNFLSKILIFVYLAVSVVFLSLPIVGIVFKAFSIDLLNNISFVAVLNTFLIGLSSTAVTIILSVFICSTLLKNNSVLIESFFILPMATSSVIIGLGYFIIVKYFRIIPDFILLTLCHGVLNVPYAIKNILPVYKSLPKEQIESAQIDGLDDRSILFKIEIPYIRNTLLSASTFCFALSCGELNATVMIASGNFVTLPLQIQRMISAYNYNGACTTGIILILICVLFYLVCESLKDR